MKSAYTYDMPLQVEILTPRIEDESLGSGPYPIANAGDWHDLLGKASSLHDIAIVAVCRAANPRPYVAILGADAATDVGATAIDTAADHIPLEWGAITSVTIRAYALYVAPEADASSETLDHLVAALEWIPRLAKRASSRDQVVLGPGLIVHYVEPGQRAG